MSQENPRLMTIAVETFRGTAPEGWDQIVSALGGTVFHSTFWGNYQARLNLVLPLFVLGRDQKGDPCAGAVAFFRQSRRPLLSLVFRSLELPSHPVVGSAEDDIATRFLGEVERLGRHLGCARLQLNSFYSGSSSLRPGAMGYRERERAEFTMDLTRTVDELWKSMKKDQRERVRGLEKRGITLHVGSTRVDLEGLKAAREATQVHRAERGQEYELRADDEFYQALYDCLLSRGAGRLFLAKDGDETVGASFFSAFNGTAYSMFSGCSEEGYKKGAQSGLFWLAVETLRQQGFRELNRGGVPAAAASDSHPLHGIYTFKFRLGTTPVICRSGEKVLSPLRGRLIDLKERLRPSA